MSLAGTPDIPAPARAFDAMAEGFDGRFGSWLSVAAQRRVVRAALAKAFPSGARLLEVGGGTGEDAIWLLERGRRVLLTDASPSMVRVASAKFAGRFGAEARVAAAEALERLADQPAFDGAYSNFAALNCVSDLSVFGRGLAGLLRPGAPALLVVFGTCCPGEWLVEGLRRRSGAMFRRFARGDVPARLNKQDFTVRYHRSTDIARALAPWFRLQGRQGVGVFVPPSAAEPWISRHPSLLASLEAIDSVVSRPLAGLGDHVLYRFVRTEAEVDR
ncbi:methyltransferase domain-containing protein [Caulobacter sp. BK020]|uniref:class I SAM-dependent methyltransferase n=1 Tax=Caulobacter sp. BK020 TaxID=2512117 RepID=UPI0010533A76|nr:methyltransferase domain-containing protein [Caulobacter sp. BK020]TCS14924.1 methyltransferase family protein [Caulobacter sp. BK020]